MQYLSPSEAAPDIGTLVANLKELEKDNPQTVFVYRGQIKEYDIPLIPSMYREFLDPRFAPITSHETQPSFSTTFASVYLPEDIWEIAEFLVKKRIAPLLDQSLYKWDSSIRPFEITEVDTELVDAILDVVSVSHENAFQSSKELTFRQEVASVVESLQRILIRRFAQHTSFGSPISDFLSQQYGMTSAFLDATYSISVAAFFATYKPPQYLRVKENDGIGVIYRFEASMSAQDNPTYGTSLPPYLFGDRIFSRFEKTEVEYSDVASNVMDFFATLLMDKPDLDKLRTPKGALLASRIGRQKSVVLAPAIIKSNDRTCTIGVENLRTRPRCRLPLFQ